MEKQTIEMVFVLCMVIFPLLIIFGFIYLMKIREIESKINKSEKIQFKDEMASMKHRLVTLEKIVTEKGYQVTEEISELKSVK